MNDPGIIFDGDDTLWQTMPLYTQAKADFCRYLASFGFDPEAVLEEFERTDLKNFAILGFTRERFPTSMVETYRSMSGEVGIKYDESVAIEVADIGDRVFRSPTTLIGGARELLLALVQNFRLILFTKGDAAVQENRIRQSGLRDLFAAIYVHPHKSVNDFETIIVEQSLARARSWSIGNSLKSDINPALAADLSAIWIPFETWDAEADIRIHSTKMHVANSLLDCLTILRGGEQP